ncbi:MAG: hypothetical protein JWM71_500, partial [Solirubrobacteraceae bacterium]|nr:hypothetical protein [Solirubrobacteraceae bacterium]
MVLALPASAPAASLSIPLAPIATSGTSAFAGSPSPVLGPVVLADGSVVVGLLLKPGLMTYERVAPGSSVLVPLRTEAVANSTSATKLEMQAAGGGYVVARRDFASCGHGSAGQDCPGAPTQSSVTLFGVHGEAPRTLMHCEGTGCAPCFPSASPPVEGQLWTAGDESQILVDPLCADGTPGPGAIDLATGSVTRFSFPPDRFGAAQHGPYELSGDYVATPDGVLNFRTSAYQILGQGTDWQN